MVKKKAFSKIFTASEVKKGLLANSSREEEVPERSETANSFDDDFALEDDFPIAPKAIREGDEDDIFAEKKQASDDLFDFPEAGGFSTEAGGAFPEDDDGFPADNNDAEAFPEADPFNSGSGAFAGGGAFDSNNIEAEEDDDELDLNDEEDLPEMDQAAFFASFSNLEKAQEAMQEQKDGKKKKTGIKKLFNKKKDLGMPGPAARCAEIVVDKSKIPTTKVDMELANGELVTPKQELAFEEEVPTEKAEKDKEKQGKSRLKSLKKTLVKTVRGNKERLDDLEMGDYEPPEVALEDKEYASDHDHDDASDHNEEDDEEDDQREMGDGSHRHQLRQRDRVRNRRRHGGGGGGEPPATDPQRRSRRRESHVDGQKMRHSSGGGAGGRLSKGDNRVRRSRTEEVSGSRSRNEETTSGGGRRRHTVMDKSGGSPHRRTSKPSASEAMDDHSKKKGEMTDESGKNPTMADGSARNRRSDPVDGWSRAPRGGDLPEGSSRHRNSGTRRHGRDSGGGGGGHHRDSSGRKSMRKSKSIDDSEAPARRSKSGDGLSTSSHQGLIRRNLTDNSMGRRAQSTRHLIKKEESLKESTHRLSSRDRLRRAPRSERHLMANVDKEKKQAVGKLFGGGGLNEEKETRPSRGRAGSDGDAIDDILEEGSEEDATESEAALDKSNLEESKVIDEIHERTRGNSAADSPGAALGTTLSKDDVAKLVMAVKAAKDDDDLEAIVMAALGGGESAKSFGLSVDFSKSLLSGDPTKSLGLSMDFSIDDDDDMTLESDLDDSNAAREAHNNARDYVHSFLKKHCGGSGVGKPEERQPNNDYSNALSRLGSDHSEKKDEDVGDSSKNESSKKNKSSGGGRRHSNNYVDVLAQLGSNHSKTEQDDMNTKTTSKKLAKTVSSGSQHGTAKRDEQLRQRRSSVSGALHGTAKRDEKLRQRRSSVSGSQHGTAKRDKSSLDVAWKRGGTEQAEGKVDFSVVASKLEAKAEAKRIRSHAQVAMAK
ncbi:expressed unknown protein [Seminavis robusta]|uniref:Uncharacterized protein n=1 Tax=Seminavis robusta TaxID=568900 RepID=A0A9N8EK52_9STRA|nr:expressed unknown protein [Seminavis robusta]|eukprot:Sro1278_g258790.1 n/a (995) ;mRNA; f:17339-20323